MKIFVSIAAHEAELCIIDQCLNYLTVGEFDGVVVHLNATEKIDISLLDSLIHEIKELRGRVHMNPVRLRLYKMRDFPSGTPILHRPHLENFSYLSKREHVDVFCLDASNTLLVKKGLREHVQRGVGITQQVNKKWEWHRPMSRDGVLRRFKRSIRISHHEGMFFDRATFEKMSEFIREYEVSLAKAFPQETDMPEYPREEILFSTAYAVQTAPPSPWSGWFSGARTEPPVKRPIFDPYVWLRWETKLNWPLAEVLEILKNPNLPAGRYGIKRIPRDINDPVREAIGNYFNYRPALLAAAERIKSADRT